MKEPKKYTQIRVEASSTCQLRCPSCPTTSKATLPAIGREYLSLSHFQQLLDDNPSIEKIELSNYEEMFLNPDLLEIVRYANEKEVCLTANNGVNLNNVKEEVLEGLVKYNFRRLTVSIDGASNTTYKQYRVGGSFDAVIRNIKIINAFKEKYQTKFPVMTWQFIFFRHNGNELYKANKMAKRLDMNFKPKLSWDGELSPGGRDIARREIGAGSREEYGEDYMQEICHQLWDHPQINWDGKVLGGCRNFWGDFDGNVFRDGLIDALNNEKINYARDMLLGNNKERDDIPCTTCDIYLGMKAKGKWLVRNAERRESGSGVLGFVPDLVKLLAGKLHQARNALQYRQ